MFLLMCESKGKRLVINSSYHTNILFIISLFFFSIMYSSWFVTSYSGPSFTMLMWSLMIWVFICFDALV